MIDSEEYLGVLEGLPGKLPVVLDEPTKVSLALLGQHMVSGAARFGEVHSAYVLHRDQAAADQGWCGCAIGSAAMDLLGSAYFYRNRLGNLDLIMQGIEGELGLDVLHDYVPIPGCCLLGARPNFTPCWRALAIISAPLESVISHLHGDHRMPREEVAHYLLYLAGVLPEPEWAASISGEVTA